MWLAEILKDFLLPFGEGSLVTGIYEIIEKILRKIKC